MYLVLFHYSLVSYLLNNGFGVYLRTQAFLTVIVFDLGIGQRAGLSSADGANASDSRFSFYRNRRVDGSLV